MLNGVISLSDNFEPTYQLIGPVVAKYNISMLTAELMEDLFNDEIEITDGAKDFKFVISESELYYLLDLLTQEVINLVHDDQLKSSLWEILEKERQENSQLTLSKESIGDMILMMKNTNPNLNPSVQEEADIISEEMQKINHVLENLKTVIEDSNYKVYYDYLLTLHLHDDKYKGTLASENKDFFNDQLKIISSLELIAKRAVDRSYSELPTFKKQFKDLIIIPPGIIRSLPSGTTGYKLLIILQRTERVGRYFLDLLPKTEKKEG